MVWYRCIADTTLRFEHAARASAFVKRVMAIRPLQSSPDLPSPTLSIPFFIPPHRLSYPEPHRCGYLVLLPACQSRTWPDTTNRSLRSLLYHATVSCDRHAYDSHNVIYLIGHSGNYTGHVRSHFLMWRIDNTLTSARTHFRFMDDFSKWNEKASVLEA